MKVLALVLVIALLLVGVAAALPTISASFGPHPPAVPALSTGGPTPAIHIACFPPPCDCNGGDC